MGCVVRRDTHLNFVSNHDLDPVLFHPSGKYTPDDHTIFALDFHAAAPQDFSDDSL